MSSVDDRIVNMQFNNKQFQSGVNDSVKSLNTLESSLVKAGQSKGVEALGNAVQATTNKFSALQVAGVAAVATIASKATNAGLNFVKSFTIQPLTDGFKEYQTTLNSTQTIISNTGEGIGKVNHALDDLNNYSDKTIYNFTQMAKNVGTFTAAGVDLQTSVSAIKGIANMAALSGSTAEQASTAMYQLSQAIASGRVNLQDWNSVVNAGMGGRNFQTILAQTAEAMGKLNKGLVTERMVGSMKKLEIAGRSFRESINDKSTKGWLSSDVLVNTLAVMDGRFSKVSQQMDVTEAGVRRYSDAQIDANIKTARTNLELKNNVHYTDEQFKSLTKMADAAFNSATQVKTLPQLIGVVQESLGSIWSTFFRGVLGDFQQSVNLWTGVGNVIQKGTNIFKNAILGVVTSWAKLSGIAGRNGFGRHLTTMFVRLGNIMTTVKRAFRDIFPKSSFNIFIALTKMFGDLIHATKPATAMFWNLRSTLGGVFAVLHIGVTIVKGIVGAFKAMFSAMFAGSGSALGGILGVTGGIGEMLKAFDKWLTGGGTMIKIFTAIGTAVGTVIRPISTFVGWILGLVGKAVSGKKSLDGLGSAFEWVGNKIADFLQPLSSVGDVLNSGLSMTLDKLKSSLEPLSAVFEHLGNAFDLFFHGGTTDQITAELDLAKASLGSFFDTIKAAFSMAKGIFTGVLDSLHLLGPNVDKIKAKIDGFFNSLHGTAAGDLLAVGRNLVEGLIQGIEQNGIPAVREAISKLIDYLINTTKSLLGIHSPSTVFAQIGDFIIQGLINGIKGAFRALGAVFHEVVAVITDMFKGKSAIDWATLFNAILSGGILLALRKGVKTFAGFAKQIQDSILTVFGELTNTLKTMQQAVKAIAIKNIAIAVGILTVSLIALTFIDPVKLGIALGAISTMLAELVLALGGLTKITKGAVNIPAIAASLVLFATSILILTAAVAILGSMDMSTLEKGIGAMAISIGILVLAIGALGKLSATIQAASGQQAQFLSMAVAIVALAVAMNLLAAAVAIFGSMDLWTLIKGIGGLALVMGVLVMAVGGLSKAQSVVNGVASSKAQFLAMSVIILAMSFSMLILAKAVKELGSIDFISLVKGLGAISVLMLVMGKSMSLMGKSAKASIGGALSLLLMAYAITKLVDVIVTLGTIMQQDAGVVFGGITALAIAIVAIGLAAGTVAPGLLAFGNAARLVGLGLALAGAGMMLFATAFAIVAAVGVAGIAVLTAGFTAFMALLPTLAQQMAASLISMVETLAKGADRMFAALGSLFNGVIDTIIKSVPHIKDLGVAILKALIEGFEEVFPNGISTIINFITALLTAIKNKATEWVDIGSDFIVNLIKGFGNKLEAITTAMVDFLFKMIEAVGKRIKESGSRFGKAMLTLAGDIIQGLVDGITSIGKTLISGAISAVTSLIPGWAKSILGINSPSKVMHEIGQWTIKGLANGITEGAPRIAKAAVALAKHLKDEVWDSIKAVTGDDKVSKELEHFNQMIADGASLKDLQDYAASLGWNISTEPGNVKIDKDGLVKIGQQGGGYIASGAAQGIQDGSSKVNSAISDMGASAKKTFENNMEIASPSKVFKRYGGNMIQGLVNGLTSSSAKRGINAGIKQLTNVTPDVKKPLTWGEQIGSAIGVGLLKSMPKIKNAVTQALNMANSLEIKGSKDPIAIKRQNAARKAQDDANAMRAISLAEKRAANKLRKSDPKAAKKLDAKSDYHSLKADDLQKKADNAAQQVTNRNEFLAADNAGKADILNNNAKSQADKSAVMLARANAEAKQGRELMKTNRAAGLALLKQSREDAKAAKKFADQANMSHKEAIRFMSLDVKASIKAFEDEQAAKDKAAKDEAELNAADDAGKVQILTKRAAADDAKAKAARDQQAKFLAAAKKLANTDPEAARKQLELAQQQAQIAEDAASRAKDEREQASQITEQAAQNAGQSTAQTPTISPSKTVLEEAAKIVNSYSESVLQAEQAIGASQPVIQLNQTNNSPVALSTSEIYRQTNNLLSVAEIKMGVNS